ncbi:hypothetical protein BDV27DRAFT_56721 [Aspergillus caelatus]|uniref:Uncharacterized protein n=1 Tax=Aspergillus caelatus TaxID=61420 RepID=A0A5N6ZNN1_9EURO|nr:uncharacterized protein BDV27DRAFT_56721 [Aspergillus caelatus]KAE8359222.1 hypothetical protein BDV27DRAFT_56721 [Aspergillus caelatus]
MFFTRFGARFVSHVVIFSLVFGNTGPEFYYFVLLWNRNSILAFHYSAILLKCDVDLYPSCLIENRAYKSFVGVQVARN